MTAGYAPKMRWRQAPTQSTPVAIQPVARAITTSNCCLLSALHSVDPSCAKIFEQKPVADRAIANAGYYGYTITSATAITQQCFIGKPRRTVFICTLSCDEEIHNSKKHANFVLSVYCSVRGGDTASSIDVHYKFDLVGDLFGHQSDLLILVPKTKSAVFSKFILDQFGYRASPEVAHFVHAKGAKLLDGFSLIDNTRIKGSLCHYQPCCFGKEALDVFEAALAAEYIAMQFPVPLVNQRGKLTAAQEQALQSPPAPAAKDTNQKPKEKKGKEKTKEEVGPPTVGVVPGPSHGAVTPVQQHDLAAHANHPPTTHVTAIPTPARHASALNVAVLTRSIISPPEQQVATATALFMPVKSRPVSSDTRYTVSITASFNRLRTCHSTQTTSLRYYYNPNAYLESWSLGSSEALRRCLAAAVKSHDTDPNEGIPNWGLCVHSAGSAVARRERLQSCLEAAQAESGLHSLFTPISRFVRNKIDDSVHFILAVGSHLGINRYPTESSFSNSLADVGGEGCVTSRGRTLLEHCEALAQYAHSNVLSDEPASTELTSAAPVMVNTTTIKASIAERPARAGEYSSDGRVRLLRDFEETGTDSKRDSPNSNRLGIRPSRQLGYGHLEGTLAYLAQYAMTALTNFTQCCAGEMHERPYQTIALQRQDPITNQVVVSHPLLLTSNDLPLAVKNGVVTMINPSAQRRTDFARLVKQPFIAISGLRFVGSLVHRPFLPLTRRNWAPRLLAGFFHFFAPHLFTEDSNVINPHGAEFRLGPCAVTPAVSISRVMLKVSLWSNLVAYTWSASKPLFRRLHLLALRRQLVSYNLSNNYLRLAEGGEINQLLSHCSSTGQVLADSTPVHSDIMNHVKPIAFFFKWLSSLINYGFSFVFQRCLYHAHSFKIEAYCKWITIGLLLAALAFTFSYSLGCIRRCFSYFVPRDHEDGYLYAHCGPLDPATAMAIQQVTSRPVYVLTAPATPPILSNSTCYMRTWSLGQFHTCPPIEHFSIMWSDTIGYTNSWLHSGWIVDMTQPAAMPQLLNVFQPSRSQAPTSNLPIGCPNFSFHERGLPPVYHNTLNMVTPNGIVPQDYVQLSYIQEGVQQTISIPADQFAHKVTMIASLLTREVSLAQTPAAYCKQQVEMNQLVHSQLLTSATSLCRQNIGNAVPVVAEHLRVAALNSFGNAPTHMSSINKTATFQQWFAMQASSLVDHAAVFDIPSSWQELGVLQFAYWFLQPGFGTDEAGCFEMDCVPDERITPTTKPTRKRKPYGEAIFLPIENSLDSQFVYLDLALRRNLVSYHCSLLGISISALSRDFRRCPSCAGFAPSKFRWVWSMCPSCYSDMLSNRVRELDYRKLFYDPTVALGLPAGSYRLGAPQDTWPERPTFKLKPTRRFWASYSPGKHWGESDPNLRNKRMLQAVGIVFPKIPTIFTAMQCSLESEATILACRILKQPTYQATPAAWNLARRIMFSEGSPIYDHLDSIAQSLKPIRFSDPASTANAIAQNWITEPEAREIEEFLDKEDRLHCGSLGVFEGSQERGYLHHFPPARQREFWQDMRDYVRDGLNPAIHERSKVFQKTEKGAASQTVFDPPLLGLKPANPRLIVCFHNATQARAGRWTRAATGMLHGIFGKQWAYAGGMTPEQMDSWLAERVDPEGELKFGEEYNVVMSDYSAFDTTISEEPLSYWHDFLAYCGAPLFDQPLTRHDIYGHDQNLSRCPTSLGWCFRTWTRSVGKTSRRSKIKLPAMNCSGRGDTAALNFFLNLTTQYLAYLEVLTGHLAPYTRQECQLVTEKVHFLALGDDSLVFAPKLRFDGSTWSEAHLQVAIARYGFEFSEIKLTTDARDIIFLGQRPWPAKNPEGEPILAWAPVLGRQLFKLSWRCAYSGDPFAWLKGVSTAILSANPHMQILTDIASHQLQLLAKHTQTPINCTPEYRKDYLYKRSFIPRKELILPDDERAERYFEYHYDISPAYLQYLRTTIKQVVTLPALISDPFLDWAMHLEAS